MKTNHVRVLPPNPRDFARAAGLLQGADAIIVAAGAGMGVDSGLPDFRGTEGLWKAYPALAATGMSFAEIANPQSFRSDPALAWGFYGHRLRLYRKTAPHEGFSVLRRWIAGKPLGGRIVTSNVDGQFQKAGFSSSAIREIHGSIHHLQCLEPCADEIWSADALSPEVDMQACQLVGKVPQCPKCGSVARPNILMFGDWSWNSSICQLQRSNEENWLAKVANSTSNLVVIEIGAGTTIPSIRNYSQQMAREYGAALIRINLREPQVSGSKQVGLGVSALQALRGIDAALQGDA